MRKSIVSIRRASTLGSVIISKMKKDVVEKYLKINDEMRGSLSAMTLPDFIIEAAREERNK